MKTGIPQRPFVVDSQIVTISILCVSMVNYQTLWYPFILKFDLSLYFDYRPSFKDTTPTECAWKWQSGNSDTHSRILGQWQSASKLKKSYTCLLLWYPHLVLIYFLTCIHLSRVTQHDPCVDEVYSHHLMAAQSEFEHCWRNQKICRFDCDGRLTHQCLEEGELWLGDLENTTWSCKDLSKLWQRQKYDLLRLPSNNQAWDLQ